MVNSVKVSCGSMNDLIQSTNGLKGVQPDRIVSILKKIHLIFHVRSLKPYHGDVEDLIRRESSRPPPSILTRRSGPHRVKAGSEEAHRSTTHRIFSLFEETTSKGGELGTPLSSCEKSRTRYKTSMGHQ
uniref:Uncharacterized protein n=1 Tax=Kalanchoe fedtschenkoi TaxID=63787 RepID=A0A7N0TKQ9_KALFE